MSNIKILTLTAADAGRILIINGDFRFADEVFGGETAAAPAAQATATVAAATVSGQTAVPDDFVVKAGEKPYDSIARWLREFVVKGGAKTMTEIRDAVPAAIVALYANENSARSAAATVVKKLVDEEVLQAPNGFGRKDLISKAPRKRPEDAVTAAPATAGDAEPVAVAAPAQPEAPTDVNVAQSAPAEDASTDIPGDVDSLNDASEDELDAVVEDNDAAGEDDFSDVEEGTVDFDADELAGLDAELP